MDELGENELTVNQKPVSVSFTCPECFCGNEMPYDDFCDRHGEPGDWEGQRIQCPECGREFTVETQDWQ